MYFIQNDVEECKFPRPAREILPEKTEFSLFRGPARKDKIHPAHRTGRGYAAGRIPGISARLPSDKEKMGKRGNPLPHFSKMDYNRDEQQNAPAELRNAPAGESNENGIRPERMSLLE